MAKRSKSKWAAVFESMAKEEVIPVPSSSSDRTYEVTIWADGRISCPCVRWINMRQVRDCPHIHQAAARRGKKVSWQANGMSELV